MKSDTLIRIEGMEALMAKLDLVDAERFVTLMKKDAFDYTRWQETLYEGMSVDDICAAAIARRAKTESQGEAIQPRKPKAIKKPSAHLKTTKRLAHA